MTTIRRMLRDLDTISRLLYGRRIKLAKRGPGVYAEGTVYRVRRSRVRAHWRSATVAVRLRK